MWDAKTPDVACHSLPVCFGGGWPNATTNKQTRKKTPSLAWTVFKMKEFTKWQAPFRVSIPCCENHKYIVPKQKNTDQEHFFFGRRSKININNDWPVPPELKTPRDMMRLRTKSFHARSDVPLTLSPSHTTYLVLSCCFLLPPFFHLLTLSYPPPPPPPLHMYLSVYACLPSTVLCACTAGWWDEHPHCKVSASQFKAGKDLHGENESQYVGLVWQNKQERTEVEEKEWQKILFELSFKIL